MQLGTGEAIEPPSNTRVAAPLYFARYERAEWLALLCEAGLEPMPAHESLDNLADAKFWLNVFARCP